MTALHILTLIDTASQEDLRDRVLSTTDEVYSLVRNVILAEPTAFLDIADPAQFLTISRLRTDWASGGWRDFFQKYQTKP